MYFIQQTETKFADCSVVLVSRRAISQSFSNVTDSVAAEKGLSSATKSSAEKHCRLVFALFGKHHAEEVSKDLWLKCFLRVKALAFQGASHQRMC